MASHASPTVDVEGHELTLSNLDKVLYPVCGFTKADVIDYYTRVAPALLPHLAARPLTLKRYPNGVDAPFFYEKQCPRHRPSWVKTAAIWSRSNDRMIDFCVVEDLATLVWCANLADLELHTSLATAKHIDRPTVIAFDLDPGAPAGLVECSEVALRLRRILDGAGLEAWPKTSGSKGMQVYVPLNGVRGRVGYEATKPFARAIAERLERETPAAVTSVMRKDLRGGKVFVDWSQNDDHKTTVCVYSLRARERPTVSTPLTWSEVERCAKRRDASTLVFESSAVLRRIDQHGDLFAPVLTKKQTLPALDAIR